MAIRLVISQLSPRRLQILRCAQEDRSARHIRETRNWRKGIDSVKEKHYICNVWFSIHDQMELLTVMIMEKVWLRVQTVPAWDPVTHLEHTAYDVILQDDKRLLCAPGWTLRDAIETFCEWFQVERERVCVQRPFVPQTFLTHE